MLTLVAGIDEVGYGPIMGPLVVASSIFLIRGNPEVDMWTRLQESIGQHKKDLGNRVLVCDSKKAFDQASGLGHLERTIRAFLNQHHPDRVSFSSLIPAISNDLMLQIRRYPWYSLLYDDYLPEIDQSISSALAQNMKQEEIEFVDFRCFCTDVEEFNRLIESTGNKANVVTTLVLKLIRRIIPIAMFCAANRIVIFSDRLGGRMYYGEMLETLPNTRVDEVEESSKISKYKLTSHKKELNIQFEVNADSKRFPVALASMVGKYVRELVMKHMNEYFMKLQPGLRPTAGYWTDGWRFLKDLEDSTLGKAGLTRGDLIRIR